MASDVRIWTGSAWESIKGANGAPGPSAVSTNAGQLAKLGSDNLVLVSTVDLDARYVNVSGDTMTGALTTTQATVTGSTFVAALNATGNINMTGTSPSINVQSSGSLASMTLQAASPGCTSQVSLIANGSNWAVVGKENTLTIGGGPLSNGDLIHTTAALGTHSTRIAGTDIFKVSSTSTFGAATILAVSYTGLPATTGITVTGNISSTGTAHTFAANSIQSTAISGLPAASAVAGAALAGTGAAGVSTAYARADHTHPILKADDLSDIAVTTPATGQVLRWNGTNFVNVALGYADLTGAPVIPGPSTTAGVADSAAGAVGTSALYSRADHSHPYPTAAQVGALTQTQADARYVELTGDTMTGGLQVSGGRSTFAAVNEPFAVGFRYSATGGAVYFGASDNTATPGMQVSNSGGLSLLAITNTGNLTSSGTAHSFAAGSIQASAIAGLPVGIAPSATAGLADTVGGTVGTSALYARADHTHPTPAIPAASTAAGLAPTVAGSVGTSAAYARADHTHPGLGMALYTASKVLDASDIGKMIINVSTAAVGVTFSLPGDAVMPVGTKIEFYDGSRTAVTNIGPVTGQTVYYSSFTAVGSASNSGSGAVTLTNGVLQMASPFSRITAIKTEANTWILFSN